MNPLNDYLLAHTRRQFFRAAGLSAGSIALAAMNRDVLGAPTKSGGARVHPALTGLPHFAPKAKRVIYLHMVGGPAQMDLFDYKPAMQAMFDKDLPPSIRNGQRLTTMTSGQARFPIAPSKYKFSPAGKCGMWMNTELLPNLIEVDLLGELSDFLELHDSLKKLRLLAFSHCRGGARDRIFPARRGRMSIRELSFSNGRLRRLR